MNSTTSSRNPWPIAIVAFFVVAITFVAAFIAFAARQKVDLVYPDYYGEEMRFQQHLDRLQRTHPINAQVGIAFDPHQQFITITLPPAHARHTPAGRIRLYRPSDASLDQEIPLAVNPDGVQQVNARKLRPGLWKARVSWTADGQEYVFDQPVVLSSESDWR